MTKLVKNFDIVFNIGSSDTANDWARANLYVEAKKSTIHYTYRCVASSTLNYAYPFFISCTDWRCLGDT